MFVRDKNTQNQYVEVIIQIFTLVKNVQSISKLMQLLRSSINFSIYDYDSENHFNFVFFFQFVANCTQESRATFLFSSVCKSATAEHFSLKMKNVFHLEAAASIQKANPYSVKKIWLCKQFQVYGYFCLKQKSFFWILLWNLRKWTLTGL